MTRVGASAADVPPSGPKGSDWRGGRAGLSTHRIRVQAARLRAWRVAGGTIWLARSKRSEAQRSEAQRRARAAGQFVKRARRSRHARRTSAPAIPGHGKGRLRDHCRRSRPDRVRAKDGSPTGSRRRYPGGSMRSTTAWPRTAGSAPPHPQWRQHRPQCHPLCVNHHPVAARDRRRRARSPAIQTAIGADRGAAPMLGSRAAPCHRQSPPIGPEFNLSRGCGARLRRSQRDVHAHRSLTTPRGRNYYFCQRHIQYNFATAPVRPITLGAPDGGGSSEPRCIPSPT